jgi:hypothetical protein
MIQKPKHVPLPTAPDPPKAPIAMACSLGSGKKRMIRPKAEGIVKEAPVENIERRDHHIGKLNSPTPAKARRTKRGIWD